MTARSKQFISLLIFVLALFVGSTFDSSAVVLLTVALTYLLVYAQRKRTVEPSVRPWWIRLGFRLITTMTILGIAALTVAWRIGNQWNENFNVVFAGIEILAHFCLFMILMTWIIWPNRGHVAMLPSGLVAVLLCVAAGGGSSSLAAQTSVALAATIGFTIASQIILGIQNGTKGEVFAHVEDNQTTNNSGQSRVWAGLTFPLLMLSVLTMATTTIANATNLILPTIQDKLQKQLEATFDPSSEDALIGGTRYVSGSRLGSIREHMIGSPQDIALRINCEVSPGYLRGTVFDLYGNRRWYSAAHGTHSRRINHPDFSDRPARRTGPARLTTVEGASSGRNRFSVLEYESPRVVSVEIQNDPLKGQTVFLPLHTRWIEAVSEEMAISSHDVVQVGYIDINYPYVGGVGLTPVPQTLAPYKRNLLLEVPDRVDQITKSVSDQVCGTASTPRSKAEAISTFFQKNFAYSLNARGSGREIDPIDRFLRTRHSAHCEYFATATVLLLRQAGVPARYVTGYVADEVTDDSQAWVARNRDAHAWAEAYDDITETWFPVESTPGRSYQTIDVRREAEDEASFFDVFGSDDDASDGTLFDQAFGWLFSFRVTDPLFVIFRIAQWPLFFALVFFLWSRRYRNTQKGEAALDYQSRKMLKKVDRRVRRNALVRHPSETLFQFADRIDLMISDTATPLRDDAKKRMGEAANWYREYANARYQGKVPEPIA
ncbi:MAG: transglutaminase domain-containing protein [Planctomycetaceae bacterium]|nr:transglutaminase domain-containing protein [Planctomycetaceae bacterium]